MIERPVRFGTLSLLFLVVVICIAILAVLSMTTARANLSLAKKQADVATSKASNNDEGQKWLAQVDALLANAASSGDGQAYIADHVPAGTVVAGNVLSTTLSTSQKYNLDVAVSIDAQYRYTIVKWSNSVDWTRDESIGGTVWSG